MRSRYVLLAGAVLVAAVVFLARDRSPAPERQPRAAATAPALKQAAVMPIGRYSQVQAEEELARDLTLRQVQDRFEADGLSLSDDGAATYRNRDDFHASQRLAAIEARRRGRALHAYERQAQPGVELDNRSTTPKITYLDVAPGVDVEYAYHGSSLKETTIVRESLVADLAAKGAETLVLVHELSDLEQQARYDLKLLDTSLAEAADGSHGTDDLHLGSPGASTFHLPAAFALVGGAKHLLERRVRKGASSRPVVEVVVPLAVLQEAGGDVAIDPSMIATSDVGLVWWGDGGRNVMVRDSRGRLHLVMRKRMDAGGGSFWHTVVATGDGVDWEISDPIYPLTTENQKVSHSPIYNREYRRYGHQADPVICITSPEVSRLNPDGETLHVFWKAEDGNYWFHYRNFFHAYKHVDEDEWHMGGAECQVEGDCEPGTIHPQGRFNFEQGGDFYSHSYGHARPLDCAVDGNDQVYTLHAYEGRRHNVYAYTWDPINERMAYLWDVGHHYYPYAAGVFLDADDEGNLVLLLGDYFGGPEPIYLHEDFGLQRKRYMTATGGHNSRTSNRNHFPLPYLWDDAWCGPCDQEQVHYGHRRFYYGDMAVDDRGDIHYATRYDGWSQYTREDPDAERNWFGKVMYTRYSKAEDRWVTEDLFWPSGDPQWDREQGPESDDPNARNLWWEYAPSIVVDTDRNVHLYWVSQTTPKHTYYARRPWNEEAGTWDAWERHGRIFADDILLTEDAWPFLRGTRFPASNRVEPGQVDLVLQRRGIAFLSTGTPQEKVFNLLPRDASWVGTATPTFVWQGVGADASRNISYRLEISPTPLFQEMTVSVEGIEGTEYTLASGAESLDDGYWYWRLVPVNPAGEGFPGDPYELGVDTTPPRPFSLLSPPDNSDPGTKTPTFEWQPALDE